MAIVLACAPLISFAQTSQFFYTEGSLAGQAVTHTGYIGYEAACYKGNPWKARVALKEMAQDDYEKDNVRVWFNQNTKNIELEYVDTKCMDDSLDATEAGCTSEVVIPKC